MLHNAVMTISTLLFHSHELAAWIECEVDGLNAPASLRTRCAGPCFIVTQEHHQSIVLLLSNAKPICSTAFAIVRLVYESFIRGLWLQHCATDEQVQVFAKGGRLKMGIPTLLKAIKTIEGYSSGQLSTVHEQSWDAMCAFTHTGAHQIQRWNTSTSIEASYAESEVAEVLRSTGTFALLSLLGLASISDNQILAERALAKSKEWAQSVE